MNDYDIEMGIEVGFRDLSNVRGTSHARAIEPIVTQNYQLKRVHKFLNRRQIDTSNQYVWQVSDHYHTYHPYLTKLHGHDTVTWHDLLGKVEEWTRYHTLKADCFSSWTDCLQESVLAISQARFPYDTSFDQWSHTIVRNKCLQFAKKTKAIRDKEVQNLALLAVIADGDGEKIDYVDLLDAIDDLCSDSRKIFVLLKYFDGLTFKEISCKMEKSTGSLYKLHFDVLCELRKKLYGAGYG